MFARPTIGPFGGPLTPVEDPRKSDDRLKSGHPNALKERGAPEEWPLDITRSAEWPSSTEPPLTRNVRILTKQWYAREGKEKPVTGQHPFAEDLSNVFLVRTRLRLLSALMLVAQPATRRSSIGYDACRKCDTCGRISGTRQEIPSRRATASSTSSISSGLIDASSFPGLAQSAE